MQDQPEPMDEKATLAARLAVLEHALCVIARVNMSHLDQRDLRSIVENMEKEFFMRGAPAGSLPLGARMFQFEQLEPPPTPEPPPPPAA